MKLIIFKTAMMALLLLHAFCTAGCGAKNSHNNTPWDVHERAEMVARQIKARGIEDERVLNAMLSVERHRFVPKELERLAYLDQPLPIGEGQTISQPYIVALMTEALVLKETDRAFEVGTGSGYQAAVLSLLVDEVYTVEIIESLADSARKRLQHLGYDNVHVRHGDGFVGWPEAAPFNAVIITCAAPKLPEPLVEQLAEGGRLIVPLGEDFQMLTLYKKVEGELVEREIIPVLFVPMKGMIEE
jgi:protein-L-isoaspartate(D-aspartate) O-methyltransferase